MGYCSSENRKISVKSETLCGYMDEAPGRTTDEDRSMDWNRIRGIVWNVTSDSCLPSIQPPSKLLNVTKDSINSLGSQTGLPLAHQLRTQFKS